MAAVSKVLFTFLLLLLLQPTTPVTGEEVQPRVRPLHTLTTITNHPRPSFLRVDPPQCGLPCQQFDKFWSLLPRRYPGQVWLLQCHQHPQACKELGTHFNVDVHGPLVEAWLGTSFERYTGKKDVQSLMAWFEKVDNGSLARELATERAKPPRDLQALPVLQAVPLLTAMKDPARTRQQLLDQGVVHVSGVLPDPKWTQALAMYVNTTLTHAIAQVESGTVKETHVLGRVMERKNRFDVKLPLNTIDDEGSPALAEALSIIVHTLRALLGPLLGDKGHGDVAELFDLSAVVSDPGSLEQPLHKDQDWTTSISVLSFFVALDDVTTEMGPTVFKPSSHLKDYVNGQPTGIQSYTALLNQGDVAMFDARVYHQGTANRSNKRRIMFYVSFKSTHAAGQVSSTSSSHGAGSLLESIANHHYTLGEMAQRWTTSKRPRKAPPQRDQAAMQVIGAGLGRTGSLSLQRTLNVLHYKAFHMTTIVEDFSNTFEPPFAQWGRAVASKNTTKVHAAVSNIINLWHNHFFNATTDFPACVFYKELMAAYPDAKVILSARRSGKIWSKSFANTIGRIPGALVRATRPFMWLPPVHRFTNGILSYHTAMFQAVGMDDYATNEWVSHWPLQQFTASQLHSFAQAHDRWNEQVIATVPADRLLVYYPGDGYAPLCTFLNIQHCPPGSPPRSGFSHSSTGFGCLITAMELVSVCLPWVVVVVVVGVLCRHGCGRGGPTLEMKKGKQE